ncbi:hypothetical protein [Saccharopolyspora phatthalungensis]|uniref:Uncharacterized protein n=1 Tax=Saccharopolyspora phatthalungensis TaxID=664693 RepID=A0A840Q5L9_9PSEU|nr:hypothetical protein [Saccharopolyspora phatthalungensis]MBB5153979.1 hypothetical protein [Saccharopolyspora phatthalungensis]
MRDALHGPGGTQPLPPMPVYPDALSGSFAIPQQRTVAPEPWAPTTTPEDVRRPVRRRRPAERGPQTPQLEPPQEKPRSTAGAIVGFLIALLAGAAVAFAILHRVLEVFFR